MRPYSNFNLLMVNLWIGLCRGIPPLPDNINQLGYRESWIERKIKIAENKEVCPEILICSEKLRHLIMFEWKSGKNTEKDQLYRYSKVSLEDLKSLDFVPRSVEEFDVTIVGLDIYIQTILCGIKENNYAFPFLVVSKDGIFLDNTEFYDKHNRKFKLEKLNRLFSRGLFIDWDKVPMSFIPLDAKSELWEYGESIIQKIMHYMFERRVRFAIEEIAKDLFEQTWTVISDHGRRELRSKIKEVIILASQGEFHPYIEYHKSVIEIRNNPIYAPVNKRTSLLKRIDKLQRKFLNRLKDGLVKEEQVAVQLDWIEGLGEDD